MRVALPTQIKTARAGQIPAPLPKTRSAKHPRAPVTGSQSARLARAMVRRRRYGAQGSGGGGFGWGSRYGVTMGQFTLRSSTSTSSVPPAK
jgi:hypothetical protein